MRKIAVIWAGVFGSEISCQLAQNGHNVTLFEKESEILFGGGTPNSVMRLHMGFHYPRSVETAIQSKQGFNNFLRRFPDSVDLDFENFYALSNSGSRTSPEGFESFCKKAGISASEVEKDRLVSQGLDATLISKAYLATEGVICVDTLRNLLKTDLQSSRVDVRLDTEVASIEKVGLGWKIIDIKDEKLGTFDFLVRSTYSSDSIHIANPEFMPPEYEHHRTLTLEIDSNLEKFGVTVIDGDFLTLLPVAFGETHLVYAPGPSVLAKSHNFQLLENTPEANSRADKSDETKLLARLHEWFPNVNVFEIKNRLIGTRSIEPNVKESDRRISRIEEIGPGFIDVSSGKIDHSIEIAKNIESYLV